MFEKKYLAYHTYKSKMTTIFYIRPYIENQAMKENFFHNWNLIILLIIIEKDKFLPFFYF